jgi:outer membrane lipoprotein-sorting protein
MLSRAMVSRRAMSVALWAMMLVVVMGRSGLCALSGEEIIRKALDLNQEIKDYKAQVTVTTEVEKADVPVRHVTVYYKHPRKMHVESDSLVFVPKAAINLHSLGSMITSSSRCTLAGQKEVEGRPVYMVEVLPAEGSGKDERLVVWVWGDSFTVHKMAAYRGQQQQFEVRWVYQKVSGKYWMPRWIIFSAPTGRLPGGKRGKVTLYFSEVEVNTGIDDAVFEGK